MKGNSTKVRHGSLRSLLTAIAILALMLGAPVRAEGDSSGDDPGLGPVPASDTAVEIQKFSTEDVYTIVAPIALYPDKVLGQLLPCTAFPEQLVKAQRFLAGGGNPANPPDTVEWDSSIVAIMRFPSIVKMLTDEPDWCQQISLCVTYQMDDVTAAIQQVRREAQAAGNLVSNDKFTVSTVSTSNDQNISESNNTNTISNVITIEPTNTQSIYIPVYDPGVVVVQAIPPCETCAIPVAIDYGPPCTICDCGCFTNTIGWYGLGVGIFVHDFWDFHHHGWHHHDHPVLFASHHTHVPDYYMKHAGLHKSPPVNLSGAKTHGLTSKTVPHIGPKSIVKPNGVKSDYKPNSKVGPTHKIDSGKQPIKSTDKVQPIVPSHKPPIGPSDKKIGPHSDTEGLGKRGNAVTKESIRGNSSRTPDSVKKTPPVKPNVPQHVTPTPQHVTPKPPSPPTVPKPPPTPKYTPPKNNPSSGGKYQGMNPTDRGSASRESNRGATSRGTTKHK